MISTPFRIRDKNHSGFHVRVFSLWLFAASLCCITPVPAILIRESGQEFILEDSAKMKKVYATYTENSIVKIHAKINTNKDKSAFVLSVIKAGYFSKENG